MVALSRSDVAKNSHLTANQLEYLIKEEILVPDEGNVRKRFSKTETALAIVAGCALQNGIKPSTLKDPISKLRSSINPQVLNAVGMDPETAYLQVRVERLTSDFMKDQEDVAPDPGHNVDIIAGQIAAQHYNELNAFEWKYKSDSFFHDELPNIVSPEIMDQERKAFKIEARRMLSNPLGWDIEMIDAVQLASSFHFATVNRRDFFFHIATDEDGEWQQTQYSPEPGRFPGLFSWLTIDVRSLFKARPIFG